MDELTAKNLEILGINPSTVPPGTVKVLKAQEYKTFGREAFLWSQLPINNLALAYEIETEHERAVGLVLRNLYPKSSLNIRPHLTIYHREEPFWHNWTPALPFIWETGVVVLVEGPKDARFLYSEGIPNVLAYLGPVPSSQHLRLLRRYAHTIIWLPDADNPIPSEVVRRRDRVEREIQEFGFSLRKLILRAKDPAELSKVPGATIDLRNKVTEVVRLAGKGYSKKSEVTDVLGSEIPS